MAVDLVHKLAGTETKEPASEWLGNRLLTGVLVGLAGFEPTTFGPPDRRANQAAPQPVRRSPYYLPDPLRKPPARFRTDGPNPR